MREKILILIVITTVLFSCGQERKSTPVIVTKDIETSKTAENTKSQKNLALSYNKTIDTRYEYTDSNSKHLIIENSLPKGGLNYTDPNGKEYVYAVFWTRITNETDNPFELTINFPVDSYEHLSSPGRFFKIFIPSDTMTYGKEALFNYGLDLEYLLNNSLHKPSSLQRTINPNSSSGFYVVTLFNKGVDGTLRTGLSLNEQKLFYRINEKEIHCGRTNLELLKQQK